jgi:uncharacterized protein YbjT (DUF2867 family)
MILVTGATGCLGSALVPRLVAAHVPVRALSRKPRTISYDVRWAQGDLETGAGLGAAVRDADVIIHAASDAKLRSADLESARRLTAAAKQTTHLVYISIVGIDQLDYGYYRTKLAVEEHIAGSGLPYTILRTTQWHQLLDRIFTIATRSPIVPVPSRTRVQPIDVSEVADRLTELALGEPAGRVADMGGPHILEVADAARSHVRAAGKHRLLLPVRLPGAAGRGFRAGLHLAPRHTESTITWDDFLTRRFS